MYKVFVNQDVIILTSEIPFGKKINLYDLKKKSLDEIISLVKKHHKIFLFHKNSEKLVSTFQKKIKVVKAGGGIVKNINDETLFIYRRNKWDLPSHLIHMYTLQYVIVWFHDVYAFICIAMVLGFMCLSVFVAS